MEKSSPFKFLDAFQENDRSVFFGREEEIERLYDLVNQSRLTLLYGQSGTGKTSLVRCGLVNRFMPSDWFHLYLRRGDDINRTLQETIERANVVVESPLEILKERLKRKTINPVAQPVAIQREKPDNPVIHGLQALHTQFLKPVYLIFDQFEELYILGDDQERTTFYHTVEEILEKAPFCRFIIIMREEAIAQLYDFEKVVPILFKKRLRVEPMSTDKVKQVINNSFGAFNIHLKPDRQKDQLTGLLLDNISHRKSGIALPYLQVYLDMLYRSVIPETETGNSGSGYPPVSITSKDIDALGPIDDVLGRFLTEVEAHLAGELELEKETINAVMDGFVTDEKTKRPVQYRREHDLMILATEADFFFPTLSPETLTRILEGLERNRIIRIENESIELAHDSLAEEIDKRRSADLRLKREVISRLHNSFIEYQKSGQHLNEKQLESILQVAGSLSLDPAMASFIEASRFHNLEVARVENERMAKEQALEQEKVTTRKQRKLIGVMAVLILGALAATILAITNQRKAEQAGIIAKARQLEADSLRLIAEEQGLQASDARDSIRDILNSIDEITAGLVEKVQSGRMSGVELQKVQQAFHQLSEPAPKPALAQMVRYASLNEPIRLMIQNEDKSLIEVADSLAPLNETLFMILRVKTPQTENLQIKWYNQENERSLIADNIQVTDINPTQELVLKKTFYEPGPYISRVFNSKGREIGRKRFTVMSRSDLRKARREEKKDANDGNN